MSQIPVTKIDFEKTEIMVERNSPVYYFAELDNKFDFSIPSSLNPRLFAEEVRTKTKEYKRMEFINPRTGKISNYLIPRDKEGFVNCFVSMEKMVIDEIIEEKIKYKLVDNTHTVIRNIKQLPWWKRLFNKF